MRLGVALVVFVSAAAPASAEIAVLANGQTLKVASRRSEDGLMVLVLKGGGEVGLAPEMVRGFVPDEIVDEIAAAEGATSETWRGPRPSATASIPTWSWRWWRWSRTSSPAPCRRRARRA